MNPSEETVICETKKQKLAPNENLYLSAFEKLPVEIIEEIVDELDNEDILNLFLVNKRINGILSNNTRIMDNFYMIFPKVEDIQSDRFNFIGIRKYSSFEFRMLIDEKSMKVAKKFLKPYAPYIHYALFIPRYGEREPTVKMIIGILLVLKNLKNIEVLSMQSADEIQESSVKPVNLPNLKQLNIEAENISLNIFNKCQLDNLWVESKPWNRRRDTHFNRIHLKSLLQTQNNLKSLHCIYDHNLFGDDSLTKVNFKLQSLTFKGDDDDDDWMRMPNERVEENLKIFLNKHADTLQTLELDRTFDLLGVHSNFPHLKSLILACIEPSGMWNFVMGSLKFLRIYGRTKILKTIALNFPNLKEIKLENVDINDDFLEYMAFVEILSLQYCRLDTKLSIAKLKYLVLQSCNNYHFKGFNLANNQLKKLEIRHFYSHCIKELIEHEDTKLISLKLKFMDERLMSDMQPVIDQNKHKIREVIMEHCHGAQN